MTKPPQPRYQIVTDDSNGYVLEGASVTYSLVRTNVLTDAAGQLPTIPATEPFLAEAYPAGHPYLEDAVVRPRVRWVLVPESRFDLHPATTEGFGGSFRSANYDVRVRWTRPGTHRVTCMIQPPGPWGEDVQVIHHRQHVLTPEEDDEAFDLEWRLVGAVGDNSTDARIATSPERAAADVFSMLRLAEQIERTHPTTSPAAKHAGARARTAQNRWATRLYELLLSADLHSDARHYIRALHSNAVDTVALKVFLGFGHSPPVAVMGAPRKRAFIFDWTEPSGPSYSGRYRGAGSTYAAAIADALLAWADDNQYPDGTVRFELTPYIAGVLAAGELPARVQAALRDELSLDLAAFVPGMPLEGGFSTTAPIDLGAVLDGVATATALMAVAVMLAAPVPGSRAVAALMWTSAVSGAAGSTVRLATRREQGVHDATADAIDILGIASSLLMLPAGAALWRQGANVALREAVLHGASKKPLVMSLVGQLVTDGLQGVLIAKEGLTKILVELEDGRNDPITRLTRIAELAAQLGATGALVYIGARGNLDDVVRLRDGGDEGLQRLIRRDEEVDLLDGTGSSGDTRNGRHIDDVDVTPPGAAIVVRARSQLTPEAEAALGTLTAAEKQQVQRMLDAEDVSANILFTRAKKDALDVADAFVRTWKQWGELGLPANWWRVYVDTTHLDGVRYLNRVPEAKRLAEFSAAGWACQAEQMYHELYENAGHSVKRHGPHIPDGPGDILEQRVTTGYSAEIAEHTPPGDPDGPKTWQRVAAPTDRSSRFHSFEDWLAAHDSALHELEKTFPGVSQFKGPIVGKKGKKYALAEGYIPMRDLDQPDASVHRSIGESWVGVEDAHAREVTLVRPSGAPRTGTIYSTTQRTRSSEVRFVHVTLGWVAPSPGRTGRWIIVAMYPASRAGHGEALAAAIRLNKKPAGAPGAYKDAL